MFANCYGYDGVDKAIKLLKNEIVQDGWNVGINSITDLDVRFVSCLVSGVQTSCLLRIINYHVG